MEHTDPAGHAGRGMGGDAGGGMGHNPGAEQQGHVHGETFLALPLVNGRVFDVIRAAITRAVDDQERRGAYKETVSTLENAFAERDRLLGTVRRMCLGDAGALADVRRWLDTHGTDGPASAGRATAGRSRSPNWRANLRRPGRGRTWASGCTGQLCWTSSSAAASPRWATTAFGFGTWKR